MKVRGTVICLGATVKPCAIDQRLKKSIYNVPCFFSRLTPSGTNVGSDVPTLSSYPLLMQFLGGKRKQATYGGRSGAHQTYEGRLEVSTWGGGWGGANVREVER